MKYVFLLGVMLLLFSCTQNVSQNSNASQTPTDFELAEIAQSKKKTLSDFEKAERAKRIQKDKQELGEFIKEESKYYELYGLSDRDLPNDDIEIRIWRFSAFDDKNLIFVLKRSGADWSANLIQRTIAKKYILNRTSEKKPPMKYSRKSLENPKTGWESLWKKLDETGILTLYSSDEIEDEPRPDCWMYAIETKINNNYRVYKSTAPEYNDLSEAKQIVKIINIISDEFNLNDFDENNFLQP